MLDPLWRAVVAMVGADAFLPLSAVVSGCGEDNAATVISDAIRCRYTGVPQVFTWNFGWHQAEVLRLSRIRKEFVTVQDFLWEHCV